MWIFNIIYPSHLCHQRRRHDAKTNSTDALNTHSNINKRQLAAAVAPVTDRRQQSRAGRGDDAFEPKETQLRSHDSDDSISAGYASCLHVQL